MSEENKEGEKGKLGPDDKRVNVEASADVEGAEGKTHDVDIKAEATVRDIRDKQREKESDDEPTCIECGTPLFDGRCINANCTIAQKQNTKGADRPTAKATAPAPRAVASSGRVD